MMFKESQNRNAHKSAVRRLWLNGGTKIFKLSRARHAFTLIAMSCQNKGRRLRFWCPAYFCNRALGPLRQTGIEIVFYPVDRDMIPDWPACEKLAAESPPDLFMLVHYFGSCNAIDQARAFCDWTGAKLIEDAAHFLAPAGEIGSVADFVCYSPRKFFRIPDGGLLVVRDSRDARRIQRIIDEMPETAPSAVQSRLVRLKRGLKRLLRLEGGQSEALSSMCGDPARPSPEPFQHVLMSSVAEQALEHAVRRRQRIALITDTRSQFETSVREILKNVNRIEEIEKADGATSWMGLRCQDETAAQLVLNRLREGGIRALNWPGQLPPEACPPETPNRALQLRSTTILAVRLIRSRRRASSLPGEPGNAQAPR